MELGPCPKRQGLRRSGAPIEQSGGLHPLVSGPSTEGFDVEWREVTLLVFEAGRVYRFEVFDEADLDAAIARFDELDPPPGPVPSRVKAMRVAVLGRRAKSARRWCRRSRPPTI